MFVDRTVESIALLTEAPLRARRSTNIALLAEGETVRAALTTNMALLTEGAAASTSVNKHGPPGGRRNRAGRVVAIFARSGDSS